jgi:hypothetical protein
MTEQEIYPGMRVRIIGNSERSGSIKTTIRECLVWHKM